MGVYAVEWLVPEFLQRVIGPVTVAMSFSGFATAVEQGEDEDDVEEEEQEEVPEDLANLPPDVQQRRILMRSGL